MKYIVKSDLTAFYQFIDHSVLAEELLLTGVDYDLIQGLVELLAEVQGRNYGLPQLLDASDGLSELYADRIERDLLRSGFSAWRFNDDFRVACDTYADALAAIEALDDAARKVGLVLSEKKTVTVGTFKYTMDTFDLSAPANPGELPLEDVEDMIGDYDDEFGDEDADEALKVLQRAQLDVTDLPSDISPEGIIEVRDLQADDVRLLRRAINGLTLAADARGMEHVRRLAIYGPSLMPNLMRYLLAVGKAHQDDASTLSEIAATLDNLASGVSLNPWQNLWVIDVVRELGLLDPTSVAESGLKERIDRINTLRRDTSRDALRAIATRALASSGHLAIQVVVDDATRASDALLQIYTTAATDCLERLDGVKKAEGQKIVDAWARTSRLHACLLKAS